MTLTPSDNLLMTDRLRELAEEVLADSDLYLVEVEVRGRTGGRVVEVYVDGDEGAGLDDLADISRRLAFLLDTEDLIKGQYRLNVSSPDAKRPLVQPRQYPKHIGRDLEVTYAVGEEIVSVRGTLQAADADAITLAIPGQDAPVSIPFSDLREARVALPW